MRSSRFSTAKLLFIASSCEKKGYRETLFTLWLSRQFLLRIRGMILMVQFIHIKRTDHPDSLLFCCSSTSSASHTGRHLVPSVSEITDPVNPVSCVRGGTISHSIAPSRRTKGEECTDWSRWWWSQLIPNQLIIYFILANSQADVILLSFVFCDAMTKKEGREGRCSMKSPKDSLWKTRQGEGGGLMTQDSVMSVI